MSSGEHDRNDTRLTGALLQRYADGEKIDDALRSRIENDAALLAEVEELRANAAFLEELNEAQLADPARSIADTLEIGIEGFAIQSEIARGAQGIVYRARRQEDQRDVAVKVLRAGGLATSRQRRRFAREIELVMQLDHPGIVDIIDHGETPDGRLWFAMGFVDGLPINEYVTERGLPPRERLHLLRAVCDAVQHAHLHGVIHRDLKPANILVGEGGVPIVLDFGVAGVTDNDLRTTMQTDIGQLLGTVPYMSPEQIDGRAERVDVRSDVYALGILTYEILSGRLPYDIREAVLHEAARMIRDVAPKPLSVVSIGFRGDVETIVGKALEKEPGHRYQSALEFGRDIQRYLDGEPIQARPPSAIQQLRTFARRHRGPVIATGAVAAAVLIGLVTTSVLAISLNRAKTNLTESIGLERAATKEAIARKVEAETARDRLAGTLVFIDDAFASPTPNRSGHDVRVVDILKQTEERAALRLGDQPAIEAAVRMTLGRTFAALSLAPEAEEQFDRVIALADSFQDDDPSQLIAAWTGLGRARQVQESFTGAAEAFATAQSISEDVNGPFDITTLDSLAEYALAIGRGEDADEASRLFDEAVTAYREAISRASDENSTEELPGNQSWIFLASDDGNTDERSLRDDQRLVIGLIGTLDRFAYVSMRAGHLALAERVQEETVRTAEEYFEAGHRVRVTTLTNMGVLQRRRSRFDTALELHQQAWTEAEAADARLSDRVQIGAQLVRSLLLTGNLPAAITLQRRLLGMQEGVFGPDDRFVLAGKTRLAVALIRTGEFSDSEALLASVIQRGAEVHGATSRTVVRAQFAIIELRLAQQLPQVAMAEASALIQRLEELDGERERALAFEARIVGAHVARLTGAYDDGIAWCAAADADSGIVTQADRDALAIVRSNLDLATDAADEAGARLAFAGANQLQTVGDYEVAGDWLILLRHYHVSLAGLLAINTDGDVRSEDEDGIIAAADAATILLMRDRDWLGRMQSLAGAILARRGDARAPEVLSSAVAELETFGGSDESVIRLARERLAAARDAAGLDADGATGADSDIDRSVLQPHPILDAFDPVF